MQRKHIYYLLGIMFAAIVATSILSYQLAVLRTEHSDNIIQTQTITVNSITEESQERININTAAKEELQMLPGVGEIIAQRIIDRRKQIPFVSVYELVNIPGIGDVKIKEIEGRATI